MITPDIILDAVELLLQARFPGSTIYRVLVPEDFDRPSHAIYVSGWAVEPASIDDIRMDLTILIRSFVAVNEYHMSDYSALYRQAMGVMGVFAPGFVRVSDPDTGAQRAPKVTELGCPVVGADYSEVTAKLSMQLSRVDFGGAAETAPMVETVSVNTSR
ncbi:MAG: hypothetical protein K5990_05615 [Oscillospiraceae bacterium]|nr:hypothetical protein [Oscillospiraceae bacterium]